MPLTVRMTELFAKLASSNISTAEVFDLPHTFIHVGSNTGAENSNQNSMLSGVAGTALPSSQSRISSMVAGYPTQVLNVLTYRSLYSTEAANFDWNEWGIKNTSASSTGTGTLFNRKLENPSLGLKTNLQSWQITATLTITT